MQVDGKTAIITGAGSGINYEFAKLLLSKGCNVVIADLALRPESEELIAKHSSPSIEGKARAVFQRTDVREWRQLDVMFDTATKEFGGADIVCPGAGVYEPVRASSTIRQGISCSFTAYSCSPTSGSRWASSLPSTTHPNPATQPWTST